MTPLYIDRVTQALEQNKHQFAVGKEENKQNIRLLERYVRKFQKMSVAEIEAVLAQLESEDHSGRFGALPTGEQEQLPFIVPFEQGREWPHHHSARAWAAAVLEDVTTFAADGSVIDPSRDMSLSVGLVQVGWFENPHNAARSYEKDVEVAVVFPSELEADPTGSEMSWRRYKLETERAIAFMKAHAGDERAVAFLDGTLTISFVRSLPEDRQAQYQSCINALIKASEETGVPAVGYVDSSDSVDLLTLILSAATGTLYAYEKVRGIHVTDAGLFHDSRFKMQWGERTRTFICNRDDGVPGNDYYDHICITYLQTTQRFPPARLEIPRWVFEDPDRFAWVIDVVRAECVVGVGYPYPLETADAVAVLSLQDRERFYRLFQEFAAQQDIAVRFSRKSLSKRGRRL